MRVLIFEFLLKYNNNKYELDSYVIINVDEILATTISDERQCTFKYGLYKHKINK